MKNHSRLSQKSIALILVFVISITTSFILHPAAVYAGTIITYNVKDYGATGNGTTDDTTSINNAITAAGNAGGGIVYIPRGVYLVDPSVGIKVKQAVQIIGDGDDVSILKAKTVEGSVIKRDFNPNGTNAYLTDVYIAHIGIVLNHPATASPSNYEQIGFDFRNITRSTIIDCYVGNYNRGAAGETDGVWADMRQGYGIVFGNVSASATSYCGGEVNTAIRCHVFGTKKGIVIDDESLSPSSAAHASTIEACDVQICESGIVQESRYNAGTVIENNTVQNIDNARGSSNTTYVYRIEGYAVKLEGAYVEAMDADYVLKMGANSRINKAFLGYITSNGIISDLGTSNYIQHFDEPTDTFVESYNGIINKKAWVKFDNSGSIIASNGVSSVTRIGTGDFQINWSQSFSSANYAVSFANNVDTSGNAGLVTIRSQASSNIRIHTYKLLNGGSVSQADFDYVIVYANVF